MEINCIEEWMSTVRELPYVLSTCVTDNTPEIRWIANLSNGLTIYDSVNNDDLSIPSAWLRLKKFCHEKHVTITQLRLQYHKRLITLAPHADGYFFAKRMAVLVNVINSYKQMAIGIGYLHNGTLHIEWFTDQGMIDSEIRKVEKTNKHQFISLIVNNDI